MIMRFENQKELYKRMVAVVVIVPIYKNDMTSLICLLQYMACNEQ